MKNNQLVNFPFIVVIIIAEGLQGDGVGQVQITSQKKYPLLEILAGKIGVVTDSSCRALAFEASVSD